MAAALAAASQTQTSLDAISDEVASEIFKLEAAANGRREPLYGDRARELSSVPKFWGSALLGHRILRTLATAQDEAILEHLLDMRVEEASDVASGYTMSFTFGANPYFHNRTIEKRIRCARRLPALLRALLKLGSSPAP